MYLIEAHWIWVKKDESLTYILSERSTQNLLKILGCAFEEIANFFERETWRCETTVICYASSIWEWSYSAKYIKKARLERSMDVCDMKDTWKIELD